MNILLVYPNREKPYFKEKNEKTKIFHHILSKIAPFPKQLTLPLLAATTPKKHNVEIIDGSNKNIDFNKRYDLVGIHCNTSTAFIAYKIADKFKKIGTKVVIGGWHASALPHEAKQHADSVVIGEADETWPQILEDFEKQKTKSKLFDIDGTSVGHSSNFSFVST